MTKKPTIIRKAALAVLLATPILSACSSAQDDLTSAAQDSLAAGELRIALAQASDAIERDPSDGDARLLAADIAMRLGNPDRAISELKQVPLTGANAGLVSARLAEAHLENGSFRAAKQALSKAEFSDGLQYVVAANLNMAEGDYDTAYGMLDEGLAQFPDHPRLQVLDAQRLFTSARPKEAMERLAPLVQAQPVVVEAQMLAGQIALTERDPLAAKGYFETVLNAKPAQQTAMLALAAIARDAGDEETAKKWIGQTANFGTPQPLGLLFATQMTFDAGDIDKANEMLEGVPPKLSRLPQYQRLAGFIASARDQHLVAIRELEKYTAQVDADVPARRVLAQNLAATERFEEALAVLTPIIDHPQADGGTLLLARSLAAQSGQGDVGRIEAALARREGAAALAKPMLEAGKAIRAGDWAKADAIYAPLTTTEGAGDPALLNNAAAVKSKLGQHDAAVALARRALALAPQSPEIMDTLAWSLWQSGKGKDEALSLLGKARELAPQNREIANHWAIVQAG
jgi:tetratricopeptide (TPR) repeat protein